MRPRTVKSIAAIGRLLIVGALAAVAGTLWAAAPAYAHAVLVSSDPPEGGSVSPDLSEVTLTFNGPMHAEFAQVTVVDATGAQRAWRLAPTPSAIGSSPPTVIRSPARSRSRWPRPSRRPQPHPRPSRAPSRRRAAGRQRSLSRPHRTPRRRRPPPPMTPGCRRGPSPGSGPRPWWPFPQPPSRSDAAVGR